jgi:hypothetical protein
MRTDVKLASATILFGVLGVAMLSIQQRNQASTVLPAAAHNVLTPRYGNSPDHTPGPMPPQAMVTQAPVAVQTAPTDTSGALDAPAIATRPEVTFQNGLLGIRAENSSMGDVLRAVQHATGATIDLPGPARERVSVNLGPGALRDIVTSLLDRSRYDYMLVISQQSNSIERIVLTERRDSRDLPSLSNATVSGQHRTIEQHSETPQPPMRNLKQIMEQQQRQFEKQFGACISQGCDAS